MEASEQGARIDNSRIEMMRGYAEAPGCRRQYLLGYFGDRLDRPCGNCDGCGGESTHGAPAADSRKPEPAFPLQSRVRHPLWGDGVVMRNESDRMTVFFDDEGYKTLSLRTILARGLLRRIT
jgi:ATP-dependent DNA helicase RecQ